MYDLSLFDGMSCFREALKQLGIKVHRYYASEIDRNAIKVAMKNHPDIIQLGDVTKWREWNIDWSKIRIIAAGSPCQGVSLAGKRKGLGDSRSGLFFVFVEIYEHAKKFNPDVKFLLENVRMNVIDRNTITNLLGVKPIVINSSLVSAQNRERWYWTNIPNVTMPDDRGITLDSIVPGAVACHQCGVWDKILGKYVFPLKTRKDGKSNCVTTTRGNTGFYINENTKHKYSIELAEQLQTLPIGYTDVNGLSDTDRYKMVGNGWTIEVIKHILKNFS